MAGKGRVRGSFMVYLVASNWGRSFSGGFLAPAVMDTLITAWSLVYFASLRRDGGTRTRSAGEPSIRNRGSNLHVSRR